MNARVTIVICTKNRADSLRSTLQSIGETRILPELPTEVVVVDNGSTDHTQDVIRSARSTRMPVRCVVDVRRGKGQACNAGFLAAEGNIILSTDDDVRVPADWIESMCRPIVEGKADMVQGGIVPAEHLQRPWLHSAFLAVSATVVPSASPDGLQICVGANLAFSRSVLESVKGYDPLLGPGSAVGQSEDYLFGAMAREAGFRAIYADGAPVVHHFDAARLTPAGVLDMARRIGRSTAFIDYHWAHKEKRLSRLSRLMLRSKLVVRSILGVRRATSTPQWQYCYERELAYQGELRALHGTPRRYKPRATQAILTTTPI